MAQLAPARAPQQEEPQNKPTLPKPTVEQDPELKAKIAKVSELIPKDHQHIGSKHDKAYAQIKTEVEAFIKKHTPPLKEQLNLLTDSIRASGEFDPVSYQKQMLEFQERTQRGEPGFLPAPVEAVYQAWKKTEAALKPESDVRKSMELLDKKASPELMQAFTREQYSTLLRGMHEVENPKSK